MNISKYVRKRERFERRCLIGPIAERNAVLSALHEKRWSITYAGAYTTRAMHPECDDSRFMIIVERKLR